MSTLSVRQTAISLSTVEVNLGFWMHTCSFHPQLPPWTLYHVRMNMLTCLAAGL